MPHRWLKCLALFCSYLGVLGVLAVAFGMIGRVLPVRNLHISVLIALIGAGCAGHARTNPSFDLTAPAARGALRQMAASPRRLERPVVVLGGFGDPGVAPNYLAGEVRKLTGDRRVLPVSFGFWESLDELRGNERGERSWAPRAAADERERGYARWNAAVERSLNWR